MCGARAEAARADVEHSVGPSSDPAARPRCHENIQACPVADTTLAREERKALKGEKQTKPTGHSLKSYVLSASLSNSSSQVHRVSGGVGPWDWPESGWRKQ